MIMTVSEIHKGQDASKINKIFSHDRCNGQLIIIYVFISELVTSFKKKLG